MKTNQTILLLTALAFFRLLPVHLHGQGYIVPNGVVTNLFPPREISVIHDPTNLFYTGFEFDPSGTNTFVFNPVVDVGVRVFLVSPNLPMSLEPVLAHRYTELTFPGPYVFTSGVPFYVGLYTGNVQLAPQDGIYNDPLFGWARLVNNHGEIQLLDDAMEYKGGGIFVGTQNIIVPEPNTFGLLVLGASFLTLRFRYG